MGGTSCDVAVIDGGVVREASEQSIAGRPIQLPMVDVHTVGAGGGSIGWADAGGALRVGPALGGRRARAGLLRARRRASRPSRTRTSCWATWAPTRRWPGGVRLDRAAAERAVRTPRRARSGSTSRRPRAGSCASPTRRCCARCASRPSSAASTRAATRSSPSAARARCTPPAWRRSSGVARVLCPRAAGVLSALGLATASRRRDAARTVLMSRGRTCVAGRCAAVAAELAAEAARGLDEPRIEVTWDVRYAGQAFELPVAAPADAGVAAAPRERSSRRIASATDTRTPTACSRSSTCASRPPPRAAVGAVPAAGVARRTAAHVPRRGLRRPRCRHRRCSAARPGGRAAPRSGRARARGGDRRRAAGMGRDVGRARRRAARPGRASAMSERLDPVTLQVMLGGLRAVCEEMGAVLVRAAHSANIKERRDASTALFDAAGQMVMQAEHIPVHLGAMPDAVAAVLGEEHAAGDTWILNDPYRGGTHLPDITLVSPLFRGDAAGRVRRDARASRRRRRRGARQHAGALPAPRAGGRRDPARRGSRATGRSTRGMLDSLVARMRAPGPARGRPARAARGQPPRGAAHRGAGGPARRRAARARDGGGAALRGAPHARVDRGDAGRALPRIRRARGRRRRRSRTTFASTARCVIAGDGAEVDFAGTDPQSDGQPQLPAVGDEVRRLLRGAGADRPRHPAVGRRVPPGARDARRPAPSSTRALRPRSPAATSRPRAASPTSRWPRSARRCRRPRPARER